MISVYFCIYLTNRCIVIFCLPTCVIIPYKSKFYNYFSVYFVIFSFNAKFHIYDRKSFQFWKECKSISIFSQRWYLQKKHFNENVERWFWAQTRKLEKKRPSNSPFSDESDSLLSPPCADSCGFVHFESLIKILQHFLSRTLEDRLHSWICLKRILHDISHWWSPASCRSLQYPLPRGRQVSGSCQDTSAPDRDSVK